MTQSDDLFRDPQRPVAERVADLMDRLAPAEKLGLLHQHQAPVPRLGVGPFRTGTEALHGVAWLGPATVFPQAVGLATSWNTDLLHAVGAAVGSEVRAFHDKDPAAVGLNVWAPVVNPLRDPRWGRNEEGYSEDPWLTGELAIAFGSGLAGDGSGPLQTAPTLKHFLAYNNETDRCTTSSSMPARVLREYELPAFEAPLRAGAAVAVMPSYNLINGRPAHLTPLINDVLRGWSDQEVLVVSDAGAPANLFGMQDYCADGAIAYAAALRAGVDSFTQDDNDPSKVIGLLEEALARGLITQQDIDRAAARALTLRFRLGEFDPVGETESAPDIVGCQAHRDLARDAARQSFVLLKNEELLPLSTEIRRVAVLGPLADTLQEDWYSGTLPYQVTAVKALTERLGPDAVEYCEGADRVQFGADGTALEAAEDGVVGLTRSSAGFDLFDWGGGVCTLRSVRTGRYLTVTDDGTLRADHPGPNSWVVNETFELVPVEDGKCMLRHHTTSRYVTKQDDGRIEVSTDEPTVFEFTRVVDGAVLAAAAAARADVAVVVVGNHPLVNGRETEDRISLELPAGQKRLVRAVQAGNARTVLVMASSYPFSTGWAERELPAIVWSAHGGQEYGHALADVLFGVADAAGRLPQTWYRSEADLPDLLDYDIITSDATYQYFRGSPLYPFGHGLSYTTFAYGELEIGAPTIAKDGEVQVSCTVTNTGLRPGHEVVQLYTHQQNSRVKQPLRRLRAVQHLDLAPGESARVELTVRAADLAIWDVTRDRYWIEPARHSILIGRSCTDIRLSAPVDVLGDPIPDRDLAAAPLRADAFDEYCGVALTDAEPERGDAVRSEHPGAWLAFADTSFGAGVSECLLTVASELSKPATIELRLDDPYHGAVLATVEIQPTGHRHSWTQLSTAITTGSGVHTLYVVFAEADVFLRELSFS
ncbi:glycoside hydrolase family 3 protein [Kribbella albertanoniae]|uniref:Exo-alpha-(1->6)-L-arabinopyranosidase n=1 Tax=Kribbella albertanoniae TaxID=1266829 RepID=A0A4R4PWM8_9ACTN|nr:glycoside hydrolase family 3 protein [Kribbella albertanoniae]TDC26888.1 carbohydrate-binding protein [Kribbella albertanoniae]